MDFRYQQAVLEKIQYRPRLIPIFSHTLNIPERIYAYNENLFLCFNRQSQRYEVHALDQPIDSYCTTIPYKDLDARTLRWLQKNDIRIHGEEIFRQMDASNALIERQKEREFKNWIEDVGSETRSMFAKDAWTM